MKIILLFYQDFDIILEIFIYQLLLLNNKMTEDLLLAKLIRVIDHKANSLKIFDWIPINFKNESMSTGLQDIIRFGENNCVISKGSKVLDMGSGNGTSSLIWAKEGYTVTGIELHPELVDIALDATSYASAQSLINILPKFYSGSYFPKKYIDMRNENKSKAVIMEKKFTEEGLQSKFHFRSYSERFHPICFKDIYENNTIDIKEFDIFYAYVWPVQSPSIVEMFSLYAREDAKLCLINCYDPKNMCLTFNLNAYENIPFFFSKL